MRLAQEVSGKPITDLSGFAVNYLNVFTTGFHYAFVVAIFAMIISLVIYLINKKVFPDPKEKTKEISTEGKISVEMDIKEVRQRFLSIKMA